MEHLELLFLIRMLEGKMLAGLWSYMKILKKLIKFLKGLPVQYK